MSKNTESQTVGQEMRTEKARLGQVVAEVSDSLAPGTTQMVAVGCGASQSGALCSIDIFAHYDAAGGLVRASVWDGRKWVSVVRED